MDTLILADTMLFLSTLSLRRATCPGRIWSTAFAISIHALLAESDVAQGSFAGYKMNFYPRSPCGERPFRQLQSALRGYFYPRSPCGERRRRSVKLFRQNYISIHALLAESDKRFHAADISARRISIHALLAESDMSGLRHKCAIFYFYPRSPCGERQEFVPEEVKNYEISIHALLAESDRVLEVTRNAHTDFYPRSPCGERRR